METFQSLPTLLLLFLLFKKIAAYFTVAESLLFGFRQHIHRNAWVLQEKRYRSLINSETQGKILVVMPHHPLLITSN